MTFAAAAAAAAAAASAAPTMEHGAAAVSAAATAAVPHQGVADYYAILGVGDELTWKHTQKLYQQQQHMDDAAAAAAAAIVAAADASDHGTFETAAELLNNNDESSSTTGIISGEEEERFLREIVQVSIIEQQHHGNNNSSNREDDINRNNNNDTDSHPPAAAASLVQLTPEDDDDDDNALKMDGFVQQLAPATATAMSYESCSTTTTSATTTTTNAQTNQEYSEAATTLRSSFGGFQTWNTTAAANNTTGDGAQRGLLLQQQSPAGAASAPAVVVLREQQHAPNEWWWVVQRTLPTAANHHTSNSSNNNNNNAEEGHHRRTQQQPLQWNNNSNNKRTATAVWDANLDWDSGLRGELCGARRQLQQAAAAAAAVALNATATTEHGRNKQPLASSTLKFKGLRHQVETKLKQFHQQLAVVSSTTATTRKELSPQQQQLDHDNRAMIEPTKFYVSFQRRRQQQHQQQKQQQPSLLRTKDDATPGIAEVQVAYVRLHRSVLVSQHQHELSPSPSPTNNNAADGLMGRQEVLPLKGTTHYSSEDDDDDDDNDDHLQKGKLVLLEDYLNLPFNFDEWSIPASYQWIRDPSEVLNNNNTLRSSSRSNTTTTNSSRTVLFAHHNAMDNDFGVEAVEESVCEAASTAAARANNNATVDPALLHPKLVLDARDAAVNDHDGQLVFCYIPILALRRQRLGDEERYHEDPAITDIAVSFTDGDGKAALPDETDNDDEEDAGTFHVLGKTPWSSSALLMGRPSDPTRPLVSSLLWNNMDAFGMPLLLVRRNLPFGFADAAFATRVLGRFPFQNYKGLPLPGEELPMFCYPTGCRLHRTQFSEAPLPQYYGFVVKNERGDSIYISCVSFMEPLTAAKVNQLALMSDQRRRNSLPHRLFCERRERRRRNASAYTSLQDDHKNNGSATNKSSEVATEASSSNFLLTAFDDMTTFENKTICLVSRYPFWTAFRKFLSHLHIISGSTSDLPLERYISHLLLSVQLPRPGGPSVLIPLPALNEPMILTMPPEKDLPLLDLPYHRLFACLDIKTIVTIVLGLLVLERKVIVMSTRPSLVLDVCELLRSLLFPFELCAPYVPRLTEPFKSSLDFPGAIFVGIHDDGDPNGLAAMVKMTYPEESIVVDLDTGDIDCDGDRYETLTSIWNIIPESSRSVLVSELETLCRDADIVDGQEPLDSLLDSAFYVDLADAVEGYDVNAKSKEALDDRAVRDSFLRFFCSVLGGYERFLVVPDADFLVSGNEWFDAQGFLASVPTGNASYLTSLVSTQLFQSFIQRRTEASDVHCMLFDECLVEYHSSPVPYGRLGGDVETVPLAGSSQPQMLYSLLVDQSAAVASGYDQSAIATTRSMDASDADSSFSFNFSRASASVAESSVKYSESLVNGAGDLVTSPSRQDLPAGKKFIYCVDGNPCFPHLLKADLFLPREPTSWVIEMSKAQDPLLARSEREVEEANRRRRMATSYRGSNQRRCLWQLPKLMGSHFFGSWLMCIPALVSQSHLSHDQQSRYLVRALGALRLLRSKQRIVPDEAAYRALMVACGRTRSDRRVELVKLFGLLRSDGIFPSAVTLGQYTKALAEGYSKRFSGNVQDEDYGVEVTESGSRIGRYSVSLGQQKSLDLESSLNNLDTSLNELESQGKRWRQRHSSERGLSAGNGEDAEAKIKRINAKSWLPVAYSSSFLLNTHEAPPEGADIIRLVAIWSRTCSCTSCGYIPLEEEIQAGWDVVGGENEIPGAVACPRCDLLIAPMLGYREMSIDEAVKIDPVHSHRNTFHDPIADFGRLPPQIGPTIEDYQADEGVGYVTYINPSALRTSLEQYVEEYGEEALDRDRLRQLDPEVFYNVWWYCTRFSLPLPLPSTPQGIHYCAFAAWDRSTAERGCYSAAKVISPLLRPLDYHDDEQVSMNDDPAQNELFDDVPLLSRFNLQGFYSTVWDHPDLSKLLVTLVEACDKRDFKLVVESAIRSNQRRRVEFAHNRGTSISPISSPNSTVDLDVYRVILYLAKYQCTTAFHAFFPATLKPCKGYHFWCAIGTPLPIFDRLLRDAVRRVNNSREQTLVAPIHDVADVALAFRCVFGHLI